MLTAGLPSSIAIELAVRVEIIGFEIAVDALAARASGPSARGRFDNHQRRFFLLGHLRRRQPGLLQCGKLAEQRFLQGSTHTLSVEPSNFEPSWDGLTRAPPVTFSHLSATI
jgi:hypothetical protein